MTETSGQRFALAPLRGSLTIAIIAAMGVVSCLGFSAAFTGNGYLVQIIVAAAGATLCTWGARRIGLLTGESALLSVVAFVLVGIVVTQWVPSTASPVDFVMALAQGWADLLSSQSPASLTGDRAIVPFTTAWVATTLAQELVRRIGIPGLALVGAVVGLIATALFATEARELAKIQAPILIALTIALGLLERTDQQRTALSIGGSSNQRGRRLLAPLVVLAVVGALAVFLLPRIPIANAEDRFNLRDLQENPWDPLDSPSPLVTLKAELKKDGPEAIAFRVSSDTPITRWTLAVLSTYDGVVWQVADPTIDAAAQFVPVDSSFPASSETHRGQRPVEAEIEIVDLAGPWVPHAGDPTGIEFDNGDFRLNLETRTLAHPVGFELGDRYSISTFMRTEQDERDLRDADFVADNLLTDVRLVPAPILNLAANVVEGEDFGGPQVAAIRELFTTQGFYDASPTTPPGHSYARMATFTNNPAKIVGFEEQYASTAAVLARLASIPTRVVVGYKIDEERYQDGTAEVHANDIAAWIEVDVRDGGWVPVDVTPDRSREPDPEDIGSVTNEVAVPNDPPPPPPPQQSEEDQETEEEDEEEEEEDEEETVEDGGGGLISALAARPGVVAGTVALSPLIGFAALAALTLGLKEWRRRKRRNASSMRLQVAGAWAEMIDRLEEVGHPVQPNATPSEIVEQLSAHPDLAAAADELRDLADLLSESAFSGVEPDAAAVERAWRRADEASQVATGSLSLLERTRMAIDPRPLLRRSPSVDEQ